MLKTNMDLTALRTFVAAVDLGGFGRAASQLHRTPGAVSLQLKALEERLEQPLFVREGKRARLTPAGEILLHHARRLLDANDEALLALRGMNAAGDARLGMPQDLADRWLPTVLGQVTRSYPRVRIELRVGRSDDLRRALTAGELDLAISFGLTDGSNPQQVARLAVRWWGHAELLLPAPDAPLPLLLLDAPCLFRDAATRALQLAGRTCRIAMSSSSVSAIWAAATAGLGITARTALSAPPSLQAASEAWRLPELAPVGLFVHTTAGPLHPIVEYLTGLLREDFGTADPDAALR